MSSAFTTETECLNPKTEFQQVWSGVTDRVKLQLTNEKLVDELTLKSPEGFDLKNWSFLTSHSEIETP